MTGHPSSNELEQLMADADDLIQQLNTDFLNELEEEHRLQIEQTVQQIKQFQAELKANAEKQEQSDVGFAPKGINEAIREIKMSMKALGSFLA